ncbi:recombinase family protein [Pseudoruegeria sp. SK021]|uniref:recombinase family protein n=1 Tax=Pseudoruegeria sp. SK021 TaxID=1933035 RepID=UPI000A21B134|nr:recombinase family protein [Pseudoruegeria sp. SK021]OSP52462.1 resolvase [Pseudoruegeria sp. SK021]
MPQLRAAIYARFSSDLQSDASIDDQIRLCTEYAARQGFEVVATYSDRGISGASLMRSGIQNLLRDAGTNTYDVIIAEAIDRLSRNQADIAGLYQRLQFQDRMIETVSEGSISEMHIGLKGTMNALFLKDLAAKTHRGLRGRALAGKSAGGKAYGYRNVVKRDDQGEPIKGDRIIDVTEAAIVQRIFCDYAGGMSPKKIAEALNGEQISGPTGRGWGASTLHGNRERGTGILNNELYIGRQIWNRLTYVKDPDTGKRISRLNPSESWVITDIPELRIIDQDLWDAARARQGIMKVKNTSVPIWDRRRPKTLLSGLMRCGCCGGGFSKMTKDRFGCSTARNKGKSVCSNMRTIAQKDIEAAVLDALQHNLMDPDALEVFCAEYAKERNRLQAKATAGRTTLEKQLATAKRDHAKLVDAIVAGVPADQVKDRMLTLDAERIRLERQLENAPSPDPIRIHPKMAQSYRTKVAELIARLGGSDGSFAAKDALRGLIERIVLHPDGESHGLSIHLEGALAGLLSLSLQGADISGPKRKTPPDLADQVSDIVGELVLVAGTGFEPVTFRL